MLNLDGLTDAGCLASLDEVRYGFVRGDVADAAFRQARRVA